MLRFYCDLCKYPAHMCIEDAGLWQVGNAHIKCDSLFNPGYIFQGYITGALNPTRQKPSNLGPEHQTRTVTRVLHVSEFLRSSFICRCFHTTVPIEFSSGICTDFIGECMTDCLWGSMKGFLKVGLLGCPCIPGFNLLTRDASDTVPTRYK